MKLTSITFILLIMIGFSQQQVAQKPNGESSHPIPKVMQGQTFQQSSIIQLFGNNQCKVPPTPKKLAIATVTRFRASGEHDIKDGIQFFKQYLKRYAEMQCDIFDSIYFIWNNEKQPEQYPTLLQRKEFWKKNVYFIQTKFNSMDHRFAFPAWVEQEVFMSLDDDAVIDCENMKKSFDQWQSHVVGGLGPFGAVQMSGRAFQYKMSKDKFQYRWNMKSYISMALPNVGIVPRHFYDLYYAKLPQFQTMRNVVTQLSNCDDIGLNFMISYIYPELRPIAFQGISSSVKSFKIEINKTPDHWKKRDLCLMKFTEILGENSLTYNLANKNENFQKIKQDPLRTHHCMLALKKSIVEHKYLNYDHYYNFMKRVYVYNSSVLPTDFMSKIDTDNHLLQLDKQKRDDFVNKNNIDLSYKSRHGVQETFGMQAVKETQMKTEKENKEKQQIYEQYIFTQKQNKMLASTLNTLQQQFETLKLVLIVTNAILVLIVVGILVRFCVHLCSLQKEKKKKKKGERIEESYVIEMESGATSDRIPIDK